MFAGSVDRVDPLELGNNFSNILAQTCVATNVTATMVLNKALVFRNEQVEGSNTLVRFFVVPLFFRPLHLFGFGVKSGSRCW